MAGAPRADLGAYAAAVAAFLQAHAWLYECHVVDFIVEDHWRHLPAEWREPLLASTDAELCGLPVGQLPPRGAEWPASLRGFVSRASALALPRSAVPPADAPSPPPCDGRLAAALARGMKLKKRHEVERLAGLVVRLCRERGCDTVVDVGAGMGYLSQVLHFGHGLRVVALDCSAHQTHGAERRAARMRLALRRPPAAPEPAPEPEPEPEPGGPRSRPGGTRGRGRRWRRAGAQVRGVRLRWHRPQALRAVPPRFLLRQAVPEAGLVGTRSVRGPRRRVAASRSARPPTRCEARLAIQTRRRPRLPPPTMALSTLRATWTRASRPSTLCSAPTAAASRGALGAGSCLACTRAAI